MYTSPEFIQQCWSPHARAHVLNSAAMFQGAMSVPGRLAFNTIQHMLSAHGWIPTLTTLLTGYCQGIGSPDTAEVKQGSVEVITGLLRALQVYTKKHVGFMPQNQMTDYLQRLGTSLSAWNGFIGRQLAEASQMRDIQAQERVAGTIETLLKLLEDILTKEYCDRSDDKYASYAFIIEGFVQLFTLVAAHLNQDVLQFPYICSQFLVLLEVLVEFYPHVFATLSEQRDILRVAQYSLKHHEISVLSSGLRITQHIGLTYIDLKQQNIHMQNLNNLSICVCELSTQLFELILTDYVPSSVLRDISETLFITISANQNHIASLSSQFIQNQPESIQQRLNDCFGKLLTSQDPQMVHSHTWDHNDDTNLKCFFQKFRQFLLVARGLVQIK